MAHKEIDVTGVSEGYTTTLTAGPHLYYLDEPEKVGGHDLGPNPLQALLGALIGCETITATAAARQMDFHLEGISFSVKGAFDSRGLKGDPNVRTYFEKVEIHAELQTEESDERIKELQETTHARCPVFNTLKAADVTLESTWTRKIE